MGIDEGTAILNFPPTTTSSSEQDITSMKNAINSFQSDISEIKSKISGVNVNSSQFDSEVAYNFGVIGMATGIAGIIFDFVLRTTTLVIAIPSTIIAIVPNSGTTLN